MLNLSINQIISIAQDKLYAQGSSEGRSHSMYVDGWEDFKKAIEIADKKVVSQINISRMKNIKA